MESCSYFKCSGWLHSIRHGTGTAEEIEEERRLLHVAMTRAKDELDLIVPHRFFTYNQAKLGDHHVYASVSRVYSKIHSRLL